MLFKLEDCDHKFFKSIEFGFNSCKMFRTITIETFDRYMTISLRVKSECFHLQLSGGNYTSFPFDVIEKINEIICKLKNVDINSDEIFDYYIQDEHPKKYRRNYD